MKKHLQKLSIKTQLLVLIIPVILVIAVINSYLNYSNSVSQLIKREKEKKENIKSGVKQFIDNYDLSLKLIEARLEERIRFIYSQLIDLNINFSDVNLDSLRDVYKLNKDLEDLYVIDTNGIIINSTFKKDIGLNFYDFGVTYKEFLKEVWKSKEPAIERVANESATDTPKKYAYQAINDELILEIGIKSTMVDSLINDLDNKLLGLSGRYENIKSIDLFGGSEVLIAKNKSAKMADELKEIAFKCLINKKDTTIITQQTQTIYTDFAYIEMRGTEYYKGYILQIVSDDSLQNNLIKKETKSFIINILLSLMILIFLVYFFTKKVTKPLEVLTEKVSEMTNKSQLKEINIVGSTETKTLSEKFNLLTAQIKDLQNNLENKIAKRTQEVSEKNKKLEKLLTERNTLIKEIHHRVKNNLQIISSLLHLQMRTVDTPKAKEAFENSINRVQAMGLLHEKLYKNSNFIVVKAKNYLNDLIRLFKKTIREDINLEHQIDDITLTSSQAISVGLIINEFISNSIKHAFDIGKSGTIKIELLNNNSNLTLIVSNNGKPLPNNFIEKAQDSLGMIIIDAFTEKLNGQFKYHNTKNGVELMVEFPTINKVEEE